MTHVDDLAAFVRGELGDAEYASARDHVATCADCREEADAIEAAFRALRSAEIEAPTNFAHRVARLAARPAASRRTVWDRVAWWVTRPVFGYPAWAVSAAVHLLALGVMTVVMVEHTDRKVAEEEKPLSVTDRRPRDLGAPLAGDTSIPPSGEFAAYLGQRSDPAFRAQRLTERGGDVSVESAVAGALGWLASRQDKDGSWPADGGQPAYRTAATGLATLAFLAHGDSHVAGAHRSTVGRALDWLKAQQGASGRIGPDAGAVLPQHAIATAAIAEAYAMSGDPALREPLAAAVSYATASQSPRGGWGASFGASPDSVTTAWTMMALRLADAAGVEAARAPLAAGAGYLDALTTPDGRCGLREPGAFPNGAATPTAAALLARRWTGLSPADAAARARALAPPASDDYVAAHFAALAALGTPAWDTASRALRDSVLAARYADGSFRTDRWAGYGGATCSTAIAALALQSYWRYPSQ
jgi:hypothetical protein